MTDKTKKIVISLLIIGLIFMNTNLNRRINDLERTLQSEHNSLMNSIQGFYSIQSNISNKIDSINELAVQTAKLSFDEVALIKGYRQADATVDIDISFGLKQFSPEDIVKVTARGVNGKVFGAEAANSASGRFSAALTLPVQDNYILSFTTNGISNTSGELKKLNIEDELCGRFKYGYSFSRTSSSNQRETITTLHPFFSNFTQGDAALEIKEISLVVESGSTILGIWDLLPYLRNEADTQTITDYQEPLRVAAGEIPKLSGDSPEEIEFIAPNEGATARLVFTDNLGVRYEQTDRVYGGSVNSGGASVSVSVPAPGVAYREYGDGYIHLVR